MMNSLNWFRLNDQSSRSKCVNKLWHIILITFMAFSCLNYLCTMYIFKFLNFHNLIACLFCGHWKLKLIIWWMEERILNSRFNQRRTYRTYYMYYKVFYEIAPFICKIVLNDLQLFRWKLWEGSSGGVIFKNIGVRCKIRILFFRFLDGWKFQYNWKIYVHTNKSLFIIQA